MESITFIVPYSQWKFSFLPRSSEKKNDIKISDGIGIRNTLRYRRTPFSLMSQKTPSFHSSTNADGTTKEESVQEDSVKNNSNASKGNSGNDDNSRNILLFIGIIGNY